MSLDHAGEARFEVVLAQAILNEVKYGVETNQLAEVSLLAAFKNRAVGGKLVEALQLMVPGLKYLSIGAILKDGVVIKTSNLAVPGPVELKAKSLRGSAARVAARKLTAFHTKKRPDETKMKYYELQEAWDSVQATSVLTVPIPAVRRYESASITDEDVSPKQDSGGSCRVLHSLSGAVGIVNFGLNTEDIHLEDRHGQAFQGLAHSLSPFLAYYAAPALQQLQGQISAVAKANAASVAHTRAMGQADTQRQAPQTAPHQLASSTAAPSPFSFSAAPFPADSPRSSREGRISSLGSAQGSAQGQQGSVQQQGPPPAAPNPFAQAAATIPADEPFDTASSGHRPVSPFAAAAQFSGRLFSSQKKKPSRADSPSASRPGAYSQNTEGQTGQKPEAGAWPEVVSTDSGTASSGGTAGSAWERRGSESSVEETTAAPAEAEAQGESNQLDAGFVFKRKPVSSAFARRYSTTTFHAGVLHTPSQHFPQFSTMESLVEAASGEAEQSGSPSKEVIVDDHTYMSQFNRRALSTPDFDHDIAGSAPTLLQQMRTRSTCADSVLQSTASETSSTTGAQDTQADLKHLHTSHAKEDVHRMHTQSRFSSLTSPSRAALQLKQTSPQAFAADSASADSASDQPAEAQSAFTDALKREHDAFKEGPPSPVGEGKSSEPGHMQSEVAEPAAAGSGAATFPVPTMKETLATASQMQHQVWLTFTDPQLEAKYVAWFGRKVGKVDTLFMAFVLVYITQLLLTTWTLADQQTLKWPLFGYIVVPLMVLQYGDPSWYLANRAAIMSGLRVALHAFLAYFVCHHAVESFKWVDTGGLGPLCIIPLGLMVPYKLHAMLHTVACACVLMMGLRACTEDGIDTYLACFTRTCPGVALASVTPSLVLYLVEAWQRRTFLQSSKSG